MNAMQRIHATNQALIESMTEAERVEQRAAVVARYNVMLGAMNGLGTLSETTYPHEMMHRLQMIGIKFAGMSFFKSGQKIPNIHCLMLRLHNHWLSTANDAQKAVAGKYFGRYFRIAQ